MAPQRTGTRTIIFHQWYRDRLHLILNSSINVLVNRVAAFPSSVQVRDLGDHWGSVWTQERFVFSLASCYATASHD
ncbi:MAG: M48 family metallopeptidase [Iphinoe sp. HA4291-MV1]|nr:M48 family metallopeptidase [Iphinoe sp. HA4291-MV1]